MRVARLHVPGIVHHLIWRFIEKQWFLDSDEVRARYRGLLGRALEDSDWQCLAYALMSSHIHIAAVAGREQLASWSRRVNVPFAQIVNEQRGRIGPVFSDRPSDRATAPHKVANLIAYIHNNPVRARVVARAVDSTWTSHRAYVGKAPVPGWLHVEDGLALAGHPPAEFEDYVDGHPPAPERPHHREIRRIAKSRGQINTGTPFEGQVPLVLRPFGRVRPEPQRVVTLVCAAYGIEASAVTSRRRVALLQAARAAVVHCGLAAGLTGADLASVLGISRQAVSHYARYVERPQAVCEMVIGQLRAEMWLHERSARTSLT